MSNWLELPTVNGGATIRVDHITAVAAAGLDKPDRCAVFGPWGTFVVNLPAAGVMDGIKELGTRAGRPASTHAPGIDRAQDLGDDDERDVLCMTIPEILDSLTVRENLLAAVSAAAETRGEDARFGPEIADVGRWIGKARLVITTLTQPHGPVFHPGCTPTDPEAWEEASDGND